MGAARLNRGRDVEQFIAFPARVHPNLDDRHHPGRDRAGLVEDERVDATSRLKNFRSTDENAESGSPAGADEQGGRRRKTERARAGDDEHGHPSGERFLDGPVDEHPGDDRHDRKPDDDRNEHR